MMANGKYMEWLTDDGLLKLSGWARDGLTDEQIAKNIGICPATLYKWKKDYIEISEALKKGKAVVDIEVENALLKRALGYNYEEIKVKCEYGEETERTITHKHVAPDTTAQIFWLKNRKPEEWRDKREITSSDGTEENIQSFLKAMNPSREDMEALFEGAGDGEETKDTSEA